MTIPPPDHPIDDATALAKLCSIAVRNALEGFHVRHLTDEQTRELNPIIRDAIFTALHASHWMDRSDHARRWVDYQLQLLPSYWEAPELLDGYLASLRRSGEDEGSPAPQDYAAQT
jgi:hypothetical protein